jgi:chromosomal replication initiation ATPase DnaA
MSPTATTAQGIRSEAANVTGAKTRQLAFDLPVRAAVGRQDFFVSEANAAAVGMVDRWPDWPASMLFLVGPPGSGKSHLAHVWCAVSGATRLAAAALRTEAVPEMLSGGALALEDAPGAALDERAFFHLMNHAREHRAFVLVTSQVLPALWPVALCDLKSRLRASPVVELKDPDDALLRAVLVKHFADRQIVVDEAVVSYLVSRMERSFDAARRLVSEIDQRALADKVDVTRSFVARVLAEWTEPGLFGDD